MSSNRSSSDNLDQDAEPGRRTGKSDAAFRTISEVAADLGVPQHVLRFWETRFSQIRPMKRGGGRRYYRPEDVALLAAIRDLLYNDGYTIKGVQKLLRENGLKSTIAQTEGGRHRLGLSEEDSDPGAGEAGGEVGETGDPAPDDEVAPLPSPNQQTTADGPGSDHRWPDDDGSDDTEADDDGADDDGADDSRLDGDESPWDGPGDDDSWQAPKGDDPPLSPPVARPEPPADPMPAAGRDPEGDGDDVPRFHATGPDGTPGEQPVRGKEPPQAEPPPEPPQPAGLSPEQRGELESALRDLLDLKRILVQSGL